MYEMRGESGGPYNVILISFDTLRRDHLQSYGYGKALSPVLDRLAREGVVFEDAVANCGWTLPQHATMLTGLSPIRHRLIYLRRRCRIPARVETLAEILGKVGYTTFGFCNQNHFGGGWRYGFHRGMNSYTNVFPFNNMMERVVKHIKVNLKLLGEKPFFMYIHTNDTHEPFAASEPFGSKWGGSYHNRYEGEISYVDHYLGQILDVLEDLNMSDRTLVVATSDHGTEFKEHGFLEKKLNLYEEIVQVPIIMRLPDLLPAGVRVRGQAETIDIPATILDACSIDIPEGIDGKSMMGRVRGEGSAPKFVFAHTLHETIYCYEHWSVRTGRYKLIRTQPFGKPKRERNLISERFERLDRAAERRGKAWVELYDLKKDPDEASNLARERPGMVSELEVKLKRWVRLCAYKPMGGWP